PLPIDPAHVDSLFDRYQNVYGQPATSAAAPAPSSTTGTPS
ncbi:MAG: hypothetical protein JWR20_732, partial [Marmoricola sp.]|nr:hypothetical protein [Marmoricola sp.]